MHKIQEHQQERNKSQKGIKETVSAIIYNAMGEVEGKFEVNGYTELDVSNMSSGLYLIKVYSAAGIIQSQRLVIAKW